MESRSEISKPSSGTPTEGKTLRVQKSKNLRKPAAKTVSPTEESAPESNAAALAPVPRMRRKSVFEQMESDFIKTGTKTFMYRLTMIGKHEEYPDELMAVMEKIIDSINASCYDEPASGIFVMFPKQFLHVIEGSEDTLNKLISICAREFENKTPKNDGIDRAYTVNLKILSYVRVSKRLVDKWHSLIRTAPGNRNLMRAHGFRNRLAETVKSAWILASVFTTLTQPEDMLPNQTSFTDPEDAILEAKAAVLLQGDLDEELNNYLPNPEIFSYLLKPKKRLPPLRSPAEYIKYAWDIPNVIFESETAWPIPCRFAPYD